MEGGGGGWVGVGGSDRGSPLSVIAATAAVLPAPQHTSNWPNQFGGKLNKEQDPSKI